MDIVRTPDERFRNLKDYPFESHYVDVDAGDGTRLRMHYVDEGQGEIVLCLHGQPSWSYLYRKMIPGLADAGYRVIAPDLVGFGKSDKPVNRSDYTVANHVLWVKNLIDTLDLQDVTLLCQDWGSVIGLRVVAENTDWFARVFLANGALPDAKGVHDDVVPGLKKLLAETPALPAKEMFEMVAGPKTDRPNFMYWIRHCDEHVDFHPAEVMELLLNQCDEEEYRAWSAPFPSEAYMAGARQFPSLVPIIPDNPTIPANREAWKVLESFEKPFVTAFSDSDPATSGAEQRFIQSVPGAKNQNHTIIKGAGHFLQDDASEELSLAVIDFMRANPV